MIKHFPNGQEIATGYFDIGYLNNIVTKTLFFSYTFRSLVNETIKSLETHMERRKKLFPTYS